MVVIVVPVLLGFPAMFVAVPPLVILVPTTLPFGVQIAPAIFGFAAVPAVVMDCFIQSRFRFFDRMLAMRSVIGMRARCCRHEQQERPRC